MRMVIPHVVRLKEVLYSEHRVYFISGECNTERNEIGLAILHSVFLVLDIFFLFNCFPAELCEGGNLMLSLAQRSTYCERDVANLMRQLVEAVQHCHKHGIVHCDLKPENIVLLNM